MVTYVEADFVAEHLQGSGATLVNVLAAEQFAQKRIPGSVNAPIDEPGFEEHIRQVAPDPQRPIITHCLGMTSQASTKAARKLEAMGYSEVYDFKAGLEGWAKAGHDFEGGGHPEPPGPQRPERPERGRRPEQAPGGLPVGGVRKQ